MKLKKILILSFCSTFALKCFSQADVKKAFSFSEKQTELMFQEVAKSKTSASKPGLVSPRSLNSEGELILVSPNDWCSGFFPGELWFLYEYSKDRKWLDQAKKFTTNIEGEKTNGGTHDMGFKIYCSVGNGYRLTRDEHYKEVIIESAKTLSTRFNPAVGCIKSWDRRKEWQFPVIIDNMMNLELLFAATNLTGDSSFYKIAVTHANTTLKNHFRADNSSYHVIDYDPETGKVLHKQTHQGFSDESSWARGQAWGLYGYTMCYRETGDKKYLEEAEKIAAYILKNPALPADMVPFWDYNVANKPGELRDASAAAITASALFELGTYSKNGKSYKHAADKILTSLENHYQAAPGGSKGFLLLHSTGHKPAKSEIDVPISYADYYYLEALLRKNRLKNGQPVTLK
ncbi:glucuronyl hydrolase [Pedobacter sp. HMF7647]|uniref:Glucuronyl hydrolase n=1 Tax=Hufsiella arboris TaxID=2695275 RepID=A0A7K1YFC9_9SPHI|nr:glycoside hydrolase family 88 protein [Hufsiella arboris]MXV52689.1 glucuronyl hydrolase [Hufsiella arboris]